MKLKQFKTEFRDNNISHRIVSIYTGYTRENICLILNGNEVPERKGLHLKKEFDELLELKKAFMTKKLFNNFIENL